MSATGVLTPQGPLGTANGFGIDTAVNTVYLDATLTYAFGDFIQPLELKSLLAAGGLEEVTGASGSLLDMTFAKGYLWGAESNFVDTGVLDKIDPSTGIVVQQYALGLDVIPQLPAAGATYPGGSLLTVPFMSLGVAWDGSGFWISDNPISTEAMAAGILGTSIQKYVFDAAGNLAPVAGSTFVPFASTWDYAVPGDPATLTIVDPGRTPGGLAWYNNGLLIGTDNGDIYFHDFVTNVNTLFANTGDSGFVGGLEFAATAPIPEPATFCSWAHC